MKKEQIYTIAIVAVLVCVAFYAGTLMNQNQRDGRPEADNTVYNYDTVNILSDDMRYYLFIDKEDTSDIGCVMHENGTIKYSVTSRDGSDYRVRTTTDAIGQITYDRAVPVNYLVNTDDYRYAYFETNMNGVVEHIWEKTDIHESGNMFSEFLYTDSDSDLSTATIYRSHTSAYIVDRTEGGVFKFTSEFSGGFVESTWYSKTTTKNAVQSYHPYMELELQPESRYIINDYEYPVFVFYSTTQVKMDGMTWDLEEYWDPESKICLQYIETAAEGKYWTMETLIDSTIPIPVGYQKGEYVEYVMTTAAAGGSASVEYREEVTASGPGGYTAKLQFKDGSGGWVDAPVDPVEVTVPFHYIELVLPGSVRLSDLGAVAIGDGTVDVGDRKDVQVEIFSAEKDGVEYTWYVNNCIVYRSVAEHADGTVVTIDLADTNIWDGKPPV